MFQVFLYGLSLMTIIHTCQARLAIRTNEWTPLTNEEVHARSRTVGGISVIQFPFNYKDKSDVEDKNIMKILTDLKNEGTEDIRSEAIKLVSPWMTPQFGNKNVFTLIEPETIQRVNELENTEDDCNNQDCKNNHNYARSVTKEYNSKTMQDGATDLNKRKSKAVLGDSSVNIIEDDIKSVEPVDTDSENDFQRRITKDIRQDIKQYKVIENSNEPFEDEVNDDSKPSGYFYPRPNLYLNNPTHNNFTDILLNILSRHNIKPEDDLQNYKISRRTKLQDPINTFMFLPIPLRVLPQLNNLKQLSVDPVLSVLMSNYGYYFPGSYGIHSRYRNLYGYLASNNIHNNKPFGSYKIFADTDSFN